jgi:hypothetical protein
MQQAADAAAAAFEKMSPTERAEQTRWTISGVERRACADSERRRMIADFMLADPTLSADEAAKKADAVFEAAARSR